MQTSNSKIHLLVFLLVVVSYFNSCQSPGPIHSEADRQQHAREILNNAYSNSAASLFETDPFFSSYIEEYLRKNGRQLASQDVVKTLIDVSRDHQYDPIFLLAIIKTESHFKPNAVGSAGEIGLMQIKPDTAKWICDKKGLVWKGNNSLKDPSYNIEVGASYFKYLKKSLKSKAASYISAYNMGINKLSRVPASEVKNNVYFSKVLYNYLSIYKDLEKIKTNRRISKL